MTGGPGTGKTTIIKGVVDVFRKWGKEVLLAAPTGRAAKRLTEATGQEARTIHRVLEFQPKKGTFKRNESNPLRGEALVVDEFSMVDLPLMYHLLKAIPPWMRLILVGDKDQLPVGRPGQPPPRHHRIGDRRRRPARPDLPAGEGEPHRRQRPPDQPGPVAGLRAPGRQERRFLFHPPGGRRPRPSRPSSRCARRAFPPSSA
ncbi:MAG: AAA family ATPase [Candidatus Moduliflexus flocculans]|nr:AAA family ATPase [Candidatus Moduliflexus flocculans]